VTANLLNNMRITLIFPGLSLISSEKQRRTNFVTDAWMAVHWEDRTFLLFLYDSGCKEIDCGLAELFVATWLLIMMYSFDTKSCYALKHI
jgi:hypothetical protein